MVVAPFWHPRYFVLIAVALSSIRRLFRTLVGRTKVPNTGNTGRPGPAVDTGVFRYFGD
jgi:hypothetical protein